MTSSTRMTLCLFLAFAVLGGSSFRLGDTTEKNPIRRVVTLLQDMQKEVRVEGEKEEELYEKFMCFCKGGTAEMSKAAEDAKAKIQQLTADVETKTAAKTRMDAELVQHKKDREEAKGAVKKATAIREKERATYEEESGDAKANVDALTRAIAALERGLGGGASLLQGGVSDGALVRLKTMATTVDGLDTYERRDLIAFLSQPNAGAGDYVPSSGQIVGILKQIKDEINRNLGGIVEQEEAAQKTFEELIAAKKSEIQAATDAIEAKTQRSGELAVEIVTAKDDLEDSTAELSDAEKYQANLAVTCESKTKEWTERQKTRADELSAISEAIAVLNDDDALDMFKKTLPTPGQPRLFVQESSTRAGRRARALAIVQTASSIYRNNGLDLLAFMLQGKKVNFFKVIKMIDDMVEHLKKEQADDDQHRDYCIKELDTSDDKRKEVSGQIDSLTVEIDESTDQIAQLTDELATLADNVKALDKSVAEATEQRKEENADFVQSQAELTAAVQLIDKATNKLNRFYNPALYKPPPKRELTEEERISVNMGGEDPRESEAPATIYGTDQSVNFSQVRPFFSLLQKGAKSRRVAPPVPPETFGAYQKKGQKTSGVIALMGMLKKDLDSELQEGQHDEETAQRDYQNLMDESAKQRAQYVESITNDEAAKADLEARVQERKSDKKAAQEELQETKEYISNLHTSCDFLLENYDFRKTARATESDALKNAKAALQGAKLEFLQRQ